MNLKIETGKAVDKSDSGNLSRLGLSPGQAVLKRGFDLVLAVAGLLATGWLIVTAWIVASIDTRANGFFTQDRVGKDGQLFRVMKIRTMSTGSDFKTTVTTSHDRRITRIGRFWRKTKIDELPQLINILLGQMSFVGPRPDVPGFADRLEGGDRIVLSVRPGITGPATLKYRHEEELLAAVDDPEAHNQKVIWPDKVQINRSYVENWSLKTDLRCLISTVFGS